ncbi:MAG: hypothetical protein HN337_08470, partial [Deltaproteobacteria bacterium]|nr:hypothetical protein [Deltaproteobacteria bacterium]
MSLDLSKITNFQELEKKLDSLDTDGDAKLSADELSETEVKEMDLDGNGYVEMNELMTHVNKIHENAIFTSAQIRWGKMEFIKQRLAKPGTSPKPDSEAAELQEHYSTLDSNIEKIDPNHQKSYMSGALMEELLKMEGVERCDDGSPYPLKITIDGEKWYIYDHTSTPPTSSDAHIRSFMEWANEKRASDGEPPMTFEEAKKECARMDRETSEMVDRQLDETSIISLCKASNPLIESKVIYTMIKYDKSLLAKTARRAKSEWRSQEEGAPALKDFDLPRDQRIAYIALCPKVEKKVLDAPSRDIEAQQHLPKILSSKGYDIDTSDAMPKQTANPIEEVEKKIQEMKKAKPPVTYIMVDLSSHGLPSSRGGGMLFDSQGYKKVPHPKGIDRLFIQKFKIACEEYGNRDEVIKYMQSEYAEKMTPDEITTKADALYEYYEHNSTVNEDKLLKWKQVYDLAAANPEITFFFNCGSACFGGDFRRHLENPTDENGNPLPKLDNLTITFAAKPYAVATATNTGSEMQMPSEMTSYSHYRTFFSQALKALGDPNGIETPMIRDGDVVMKDGHIRMEQIHINTVGDAIRYADL